MKYPIKLNDFLTGAGLAGYEINDNVRGSMKIILPWINEAYLCGFNGTTEGEVMNYPVDLEKMLKANELMLKETGRDMGIGFVTSLVDVLNTTYLEGVEDRSKRLKEAVL